LKDIQSVRLVRDPSVAGHGSGTKDDIALAIAERLRLAIDNAKSGQVSKRIDNKNKVNQIFVT
jgi:hypothetical protein